MGVGSAGLLSPRQDPLDSLPWKAPLEPGSGLDFGGAAHTSRWRGADSSRGSRQEELGCLLKASRRRSGTGYRLSQPLPAPDPPFQPTTPAHDNRPRLVPM